jgi:K+-transporting ATPase c subunit
MLRNPLRAIMVFLLVSRVFGISIPVSARNTSEAVLVEKQEGNPIPDFEGGYLGSQYSRAAHQNSDSDVPF